MNIPIKIQCGCGQRYAFDVEPVAGRMPAPVACPVCGADGTVAANGYIAQTLPAPVLAVAARADGVSFRAAPPAPSVRVAAPAAPPPGPLRRGPPPGSRDKPTAPRP